MILEFTVTEFKYNQKYKFMNKNIKSITLNSGDIINIRKKLDSDITKYWHIIRDENVISTKATKCGLGSNYDLKSLYNLITQMQEKRIKIKAMLMYLNLGIKTFNYEDFKKTNNYSIFAACEAKEAIAQLKMVPTINPVEKSKKGIKGTGKKETFSSAKIASLLKNLQLAANKFDAAMTAFNNSTTIEVDSTTAENFKTELII